MTTQYSGILGRCAALAVLLLATGALPANAADGQLELTMVDSQTGQPLPVRIELTDTRGRQVRLRRVGAGHLGRHFYVPGQLTLPLRRGGYHFHLDAGPEYRTQRGHFEIERHADDTKQVDLRRFANLADEGWWASDLDAQRAGADLPIVAAAEGLHYVPTTAWRLVDGKWQATDKALPQLPAADDPFAPGRTLGPHAAVVETGGGNLLLVASAPLTAPPLELAPQATNLDIISAADDAGLHVVALHPTAWELPVWVASGKLDAVMLLTRQSQHDSVDDNDPGGRPRDRTFFPGRQGLPRWGEAIYFHLLSAGIRIAPAAGSGSGANDSPLGTNRTYVYMPTEFSAEAWWSGLGRGAAVVTNGPLLRPRVGGEPPGAVFRLDAGATIDFRIALNLASRDAQVEYLEVLKNGQVEAEVRLADWAAAAGQLPAVSFDQSGWFAVRAVTDNTDKYQLALTAPYYVESPGGPRISRASARFFLDWLDVLEPRAGQSSTLTMAELDGARRFWQAQLAGANAP